MNHSILIVVSMACLALGGCATNVGTVRNEAAFDLRCDADDVTVELLERPYVGITYYNATGCGDVVTFRCSKHVWFYGLPLGYSACKRDKTQLTL